MKIADALMLQKDLAREITRLSRIAERDSWGFMSRQSGEDMVARFDLEANHERIKKLSKMARRLNRAVSAANQTLEVPGINDQDYEEWL